jgi:putative ABC transport system permease protein
MSATPRPHGPHLVDVAARVRAVRRRPTGRWRATIVLGLRMALHAKPKFIGTVLGVTFAVLLANFQLGTLFGLLEKNTLFVDNAGADLWIVPPGTTYAQPGQRQSVALLDAARVTPGVAAASALIMTGTSITKPGGGSEAVTLIGVDLDTMLGGPFAVVAGDPADLRRPDTLFFEDSQRDRFGGLNLGSVRELGGRAISVGGFTWGLVPFGPAYTFGELDLVRSIVKCPSDQLNFVLVKVAAGQDIEAVGRTLQARVPTATVLTRQAFHAQIVRTLLRDQLGISFGTSTGFGLVIGFIIVMLSMYSSVIDNLREFGTLKAIGLANVDLMRLLIVQSILYALVGTVIGLGMVAGAAGGIRSANLALIIPHWLVLLTPAVMIVLCMLASLLALWRVARLEPGMVFR